MPLPKKFDLSGLPQLLEDLKVAEPAVQKVVADILGLFNTAPTAKTFTLPSLEQIVAALQAAAPEIQTVVADLLALASLVGKS